MPGEAERCQLGPERGPVQGSGGHLPDVEVTAVGGGPLAVCTLNQVGDDDMGVELGVASPAGAVPERRADEAIGFDEVLPVTSSAGITGLDGQVVEHGADRPIVGSGDLVADMVWPERPKKRRAFGSGERQVVAGASLRAELNAKILSGGRPSGEQVPQGLRVDLADESEPFGRRSDPLPRCFTPT